MLFEGKVHIFRTMISIFVVLVLMLQGYVMVMMGVGKEIGEWYWPFIDYPMYSGSHYEGEYINAYYIVKAVMRDGRVVEVTEKDLGLNFFKFIYIADGIKKSNKDDAHQLIRLHPEGENIAAVRVYTAPYILTRTGRQQAEPKLLNTITF